MPVGFYQKSNNIFHRHNRSWKKVQEIFSLRALWLLHQRTCSAKTAIMSDIAPSTAANGSWRFKRDTKCEEISPQYLRALLALTAKAQREHYERIPMGPETAPLMNNCSQRLRQTLECTGNQALLRIYHGDFCASSGIFICSWFTAFIEEEIQKLRNFQVAHGSVIGVCLTKLFVMCTVSRWVACPIGFMEEFAVVLRFKQIFSFITDRY